jgi:Skp family chaperone for outer membrane proteins
VDYLQEIEQNVSRLVTAYEQARRDNAALQQQLKQQDEELFNLRADIKQKEAELRNLQIAHALTVDSPQRQKAKNHIRSIIADIDKTIDTLKR